MKHYINPTQNNIIYINLLLVYNINFLKSRIKKQTFEVYKIIVYINYRKYFI